MLQTISLLFYLGMNVLSYKSGLNGTNTTNIVWLRHERNGDTMLMCSFPTVMWAFVGTESICMNAAKSFRDN